MKKIIIFLGLIYMFSCSTSEKRGEAPQKKIAATPKKNEALSKKSEPPVPVDKKKDAIKHKYKPGWLDSDTYNVKIIGETREIAIRRAKLQIFKDIINIRMIKQSKYIDIRNIEREFAKPVRNGKVISQINVDKGVEILYQIRAKGLRKEVEKK